MFNGFDLQIQEIGPHFIILWVSDSEYDVIDGIAQVVANNWQKVHFHGSFIRPACVADCLTVIKDEGKQRTSPF